MLNPQLLNNLGDFFSTFKEIVTLASNPQQLDTIIAGLSEAKTTLANAAAAKPQLDEIATFNATKEATLKTISDSQAAAAEAANLNTAHAKALTEATNQLESAKADHAKKVSDLATELAAVKAREAAVEVAEQEAKDTQAKADQALSHANAMKQSYVAKLQAIAKSEGATNGSTGTK